MGRHENTFEALDHVQRRELLVELLGEDVHRVSDLTGGSREMADAHSSLLREYLASSRDIDEVDDDLLRMHTVHIPKLVDYRFVEWTPEANVLTRGIQFDELLPILEVLDEQREDPSDADVVTSLRQ